MQLARAIPPARGARSFRGRSASLVAVLGAVLGALSLGGVAGACGGRGRGTGPATIRGRLVSANGRALGGARLTLLAPGHGPVAMTARIAAASSRADGGFVIEGVAPGTYLLRGELAGFSTASVRVTLQARETVSTVLRLEPIQLLEGVVQDGQGRPLAQAALFAWPLGGGRVGVVEAASGADGRFALGGLAPGPWTLMVEAPGFGTLRLERVDVPGRPLVLRLEGEARTLGGLVLGASGAPEPGADVLLGGSPLSAPRALRANERGLFLFHGLGLGRFVLRASHGDRVSARQAVIIDEETGWLPPMRLTLRAGARLQGRVIDDRGRPVARAEVELSAVPPDDLPELTRTDDQGRFALGPIAPGRYQAWARLPGHASGPGPELSLRTGAPMQIELRLQRAAQLAGQVVDERGQPVAGAAVTAGALDVGIADLAVLPGRLPLAAEAANLPAEALHRQGRVRSATSNAKGRFLLADLPPGSFKLEVTAERRLPLSRASLALRPGEAQDLGRLTLGSGVAVSGRVLDEAGTPLPGASIEARLAGGRASASVFTAAAAADGAFVLQLPRGRFTVAAHAPRRAPEVREGVEVDPRRPPPPLELRLGAADAVLVGVLRDPAGRPIGRATVSAFPLKPGELPTAGAPAPPAPTDRPPLAAGRTDAAGRFRVVGVPRAPLLVEVRHPAWPVTTAIAAPGQDLAVQLPRPGGIEGEVRDAGSGAFVFSYRLEALGPDGRPAVDVRTQGAGFELRGLVPGRWRLRIHASGYTSAEREVEVPPGAGRGAPSLRGLRVALAPAGTAPAAAPDAGAGR